MILLLVSALSCGDVVYTSAPIYATTTAAAKKKSTDKTAAAQKKKKKSKTQSGKSSGTRKKGKTEAKKETSASAKKKQQSVTREITLTRQQIEANDVAVSTNLATLEALGHDVRLQEKKVASLHARQTSLESQIASCTYAIEQSRRRLQALRDQYVRSVKKMRVARKRSNPLAFIFSSKSFYQAMRRMRYLRKFADWRTRREQEIKDEITRLDRQTRELAANRSALQSTLAAQQEATKLLAAKEREQAATVSKLRANGEALRTHLARKQAEANALNARVAQLIAAEQAEAAAAEQRRREEQARREREAAERAERERLAAEQQRAREQARAAELAEQQERAAREQAERKKAGKDKKKQPKKQQPKKAKPDKSKDDSRRYADARRRRPRTDAPATTPAPAPKATAPAAKATSGFAAAKGSLPRPVSGKFSIVSHFGRHPLPDLPEVMYDNPGIDAVVAQGASAQAVYPGTVTGIYALPGYNTVVIISHGEYYTVYGNIGTPTVKKGDSVKAGQALGRLVADATEGGRTTIHFEVWKNREKQNPEVWIR